MPNFLIFLQNAWSPLYAGGTWPRRSWLKALARSRSGQRLRLITDNFDLVENTTPIVGDTPDSVIMPDLAYVIDILGKRKPDLVVACGKQAEGVLNEVWGSHLIIVPHPAYRMLKNEVYIKVKGMIDSGFHGRIKL